MYSNLDPFNHGTTSISYVQTPVDVKTNLEQALKLGWSISDAEISCLSAGAEKNSNNYLVQVHRQKYLLKHSHLNDNDSQGLINRSIQHFAAAGIKVPKVISTVSEKTFLPLDGQLYIMQNFITGEHYDGSQEELK